MPTHCKPVSLAFQGCQGRRVTGVRWRIDHVERRGAAAQEGGPLHRALQPGRRRLHGPPRSPSDGAFGAHAGGAAHHRHFLGYEDLNDHDDLRHDPLLALLSGKIEARRKDCAPLAGKSTLSRLEHAPAGGKPSRYAKIDHDPEKLQDVLAESFIDSWQGLPPSRLVLDIDSTDYEVHGRQEGRSFHGYYNHYCFLPLYITCGGRPLFALLRPGSADPAGGVTGPLGRIVARLRQEWPWLKILLRADSAYARDELMTWCKDNDVDYVIGLAKNSRLVERIGWELADAAAEAERKGPPGPPVRGVPLRHPDELVVPAPRHREGRASDGQVEPPLRGHLAARGHLLGPDRLRAPLLRTGQHGEHDQGAAAGSLFGPDLGHLLRRQPAPAPLLRLRIDPLVRHQASAPRHPTGSRHSRNAPAQAPQDRRPRHGLGATGQGRHGLRTPFRRSVRTRPRSITGVDSGRSRPPASPRSRDQYIPRPVKGPSASRSLPHRFENTPRGLLPPTPTPLTTPTTASTLPSGASGLPV